jgi:hypothetical protein
MCMENNWPFWTILDYASRECLKEHQRRYYPNWKEPHIDWGGWRSFTVMKVRLEHDDAAKVMSERPTYPNGNWRK